MDPVLVPTFRAVETAFRRRMMEVRWGGVWRFSIHADIDRIKRYFAGFARAGMDEALVAPIAG